VADWQVVVLVVLLVFMAMCVYGFISGFVSELMRDRRFPRG